MRKKIENNNKNNSKKKKNQTRKFKKTYIPKYINAHILHILFVYTHTH